MPHASRVQDSLRRDSQHVLAFREKFRENFRGNKHEYNRGIEGGKGSGEGEGGGGRAK